MNEETAEGVRKNLNRFSPSNLNKEEEKEEEEIPSYYKEKQEQIKKYIYTGMESSKTIFLYKIKGN